MGGPAVVAMGTMAPKVLSCGWKGPRALGEFGNWRSAICVRGARPFASWGSLIDKSLFLGFPTTKLPKVTFEFHSVSSEGMVVLWRRDLVCVYFKLNEEETGTGCFLLNTLVKFCCGLFSSWGMLLFIKKCSLFCRCLCFTCNELVLFVERFLSLTLMADPAQGCTSIPVSVLLLIHLLPPLKWLQYNLEQRFHFLIKSFRSSVSRMLWRSVRNLGMALCICSECQKYIICVNSVAHITWSKVVEMK